MKKVLAVFLVALLAFCTFSCGKKGICVWCDKETRVKEVTLCRVNLKFYEQKDFMEEVPLKLDFED